MLNTPVFSKPALLQDELEQRSRQLQKTMHIKMADVASGQRNFVVATNALRKAKRFQIDDTEQLNSALNISLGKLSITSNDEKKASLLDRMLNNVFSTTVSYFECIGYKQH